MENIFYIKNLRFLKKYILKKMDDPKHLPKKIIFQNYFFYPLLCDMKLWLYLLHKSMNILYNFHENRTSIFQEIWIFVFRSLIWPIVYIIIILILKSVLLMTEIKQLN